MLAPEARMDDSLLDVTVYEGFSQADLATNFLALKNGTHVSDQRLRNARAMVVEVHTNPPMAVAADSKLVGVTPAHLSVRPGALYALVGRGPGLSRPATGVVPLPTLASAILQPPQMAAPEPTPGLMAQRAARRPALALPHLAAPVLAALIGAAAVPVLRALSRRFERGR
jgi:hypothetical protein